MAKKAEAKQPKAVVPLLISDGDIDPVSAGALVARRSGSRALGGNAGDAATIMMAALPKAIVRRIEGLLPDGFELSEVEFTFSVEGKPFNIGVGGEVRATFAPIRK